MPSSVAAPPRSRALRSSTVLVGVAALSFGALVGVGPVLGCGSSDDVATGAVDGGGGRDGTAGTADGMTADVEVSDAPLDAAKGCPATPPADGVSCSSPTLQCEYGDYDFSDCNATATCGSKTWSVAPPPIPTCGPNNTTCPAAAATITAGDACSIPGVTCFYPEATCACVTGSGADGGTIWICDDMPPGCPAPRPHLGTPCEQDGQVCDYSSCGRVKNIAERCSGGVWRFVFPDCDGG